MSTSISRSPFLRKRPVLCPVLGEWTCFKRREDLMVLLADVARTQDTSILKDFSMNAFIALWSQVGYLLSSSEEDLVQNPTNCKEHMRLLPYDDAVEFITQHLQRPGKLHLTIFNPIYSESSKPIVETVIMEPLKEEDDHKADASEEDVNSDRSQRSLENEIETKTRLRAGSKRGDASFSDSLRDEVREEEVREKKTKTDFSNLPCLDFQSVPDTDETFLSLTKAFLGKKEVEKGGLMKQIEEHKNARIGVEKRIKKLEVEFKRQLEEEKEIRRAREETIKALKDELQLSNSKRKVLEDKLRGIKQFLQVHPETEVTAGS